MCLIAARGIRPAWRYDSATHSFLRRCFILNTTVAMVEHAILTTTILWRSYSFSSISSTACVRWGWIGWKGGCIGSINYWRGWVWDCIPPNSILSYKHRSAPSQHSLRKKGIMRSCSMEFNQPPLKPEGQGIRRFDQLNNLCWSTV